MTPRFAIALLAIIALTGCNEVSEKRGQARIDLFKQCMEMAAKIERVDDDDVSDIVYACAAKADHMTFQIK